MQKIFLASLDPASQNFTSGNQTAFQNFYGFEKTTLMAGLEISDGNRVKLESIKITMTVYSSVAYRFSALPVMIKHLGTLTTTPTTSTAIVEDAIAAVCDTEFSWKALRPVTEPKRFNGAAGEYFISNFTFTLSRKDLNAIENLFKTTDDDPTIQLGVIVFSENQTMSINYRGGMEIRYQEVTQQIGTFW